MTPIVSATILRTQSDARLLSLVRDGHSVAFEAIVERYRKPLLRYCRRFLPEERAEDVVQQAFLATWSSVRAGTEVVDLSAWLFRLTRNAALDVAKRAGYDYAELTEALTLSPAAEREVERRWVVRETLAGIAALPDNQREALLRTVVEGQSRAEIARELSLSEGAVRQLVHRARRTLREAATAITPAPLVEWAAGLGSTGGGQTATRIAELVAEGGAAGGAAVLIKTGTAVVAAGALAVGTVSQVERLASRSDEAAASEARTAGGFPRASSRLRTSTPTDDAGSGERRTARRPTSLVREDNSGPGSLNSGPESLSSGPGSGGPTGDSSGPGPGRSGSGRSGSGGSGSSGPGSSGSGSSGSGSSGSESSGSGSSGSGQSGSGGSGSSGSGGGGGSGSSGGDDDDDDGGNSGSGGGSGGGDDDDDSGGGGDPDSGDDDDDDDDNSGSGGGGGKSGPGGDD